LYNIYNKGIYHNKEEGRWEMKSEEVIFKGKHYIVFHKYSSGYWEIREKDKLHVMKLVHKTEIEEVSKRPLPNS
jgi:hypothetical protein